MNKDTTVQNPLLCDVGTGLCETLGGKKEEKQQYKGLSNAETVKVVYFTDPICSSCWGIEPQLRKLKLEYGNSITLEYKMGGLLADWRYNSGGISGPSDVAHHWDEVSLYYDMPIDGDVWLEDPLASSYPPSVAFKAAEMQSRDKAVLFLREIREMVFLQKLNICKWEHLAVAAQKTGLDVAQLKSDIGGPAKMLFEEDLKLAAKYGVRGFPSLYFENDAHISESVYGTKPYGEYEAAVLKVKPGTVKSTYSKDWETLFTRYCSLTAKEFSELSGTPRTDSEEILDALTSKGLLRKTVTKNGSLWTMVQKYHQSIEGRR